MSRGVELTRGPTPLRELADTRAYLGRRVTLFAQVVLGFFLFVIAVNALMDFVATTESGAFYSAITASSAGLVVLSAVVWVIARTGRRTVIWLRFLETGLTILCAAAVSTIILFPFEPGLSFLLGSGAIVFLSSVLVVRAAIVPSGAVYTGIVGTCCVVGLALAISHGWDAPMPAVIEDPPGEFAFAHHTALGSFFVGASIAISRITHGLRTKVREAMQLGQYTLGDKIGEGGMGEVYEARHAMLRRPTAIKILSPEKGGEQAIARFEREVQQTSRLTHPNTVAIYDFGHSADGLFYYAMEYLEGVTLAELVEEDGPQPPERVIHVVGQVAGALAEAHELGLVHRDVKPANIVVCQRGDSADLVKVLDFGLVKDIAASEEMELSTASTITGTPLYLAPESLVEPDTVDGRTDLYALGAVAYYLLTGAPPFDGKTMVEVCGHHLHSEPESPSSRRGAPIGDDLEAIVLRCLAKDKASRPPGARELQDALSRCQAAGRWTRERALAWWSRRASA